MTVKHEPAPRKGKKQPQSQPQVEPQLHVVTGPPNPLAPFHAERSIQHDINHVAGLAGIEQSLDDMTSALYRITSDSHDFSLSTAHNADPVKITLADNDYSDTMDRLITAFRLLSVSLTQ
jgi:hypothetical protein